MNEGSEEKSEKSSSESDNTEELNEGS